MAKITIDISDENEDWLQEARKKKPKGKPEPKDKKKASLAERVVARHKKVDKD